MTIAMRKHHDCGLEVRRYSAAVWGKVADLTTLCTFGTVTASKPYGMPPTRMVTNSHQRVLLMA